MAQAGETPSTAELRALVNWVDTQSFDGLFSCTSVARMNPALESLTPSAYVTLGMMKEGPCAANQQKNATAVIFATCLPHK